MTSLRIESVKFQNVNCFDELSISFKDRYSIICGTNGIGKTTILNAIGLAFSNLWGIPLVTRRTSSSEKSTINISIRTDHSSIGTIIDVKDLDPGSSLNYHSNISDHASKIINLNTKRDFSYQKLISVSRDAEREAVITQGMAETGIEHVETKNWFVNRFLFRHIPGGTSSESNENLDTSISCFSLMDPRVSFSHVNTATFDIYVSTPSGVLPYEYLSSGYRSALSLLLGIIREIEFRRLGVTASNFAGVILIDELDLHLHPTWQQVMPHALRSTFPRAQIIVTSHSPHMIQEASSDQVIALRADEVGQTRHNAIVLGKYGFRGWTVEEILEDVMGLPDAQTATYRKLLKEFDMAVDQEDSKEVTRLRDELIELLHPSNPLQKFIRIQAAPFVGLSND